jgi:hypothetical protein
MKIVARNQNRPNRNAGLFAAFAMAASTFSLKSLFPRTHPRGMALNVINVGRINQRYPVKDLLVVNAATASIPQGAIVCLSWTPDGVAHTTVAPTTLDIINSHQKGVVLDAAGLPGNPSSTSQLTGRVRIQGPCNALLAASGTYSAEDPLFIIATGSVFGTLTLAKSANATGPATSTLIQASGFVPTTIASNSSVALGAVIFDGTAVNVNRYQP